MDVHPGCLLSMPGYETITVDALGHVELLDRDGLIPHVLCIHPSRCSSGHDGVAKEATQIDSMSTPDSVARGEFQALFAAIQNNSSNSRKV